MVCGVPQIVPHGTSYPYFASSAVEGMEWYAVFRRLFRTAHRTPTLRPLRWREWNGMRCSADCSARHIVPLLCVLCAFALQKSRYQSRQLCQRPGPYPRMRQ